jgi:hypothetical protein
MPVAKSKKRKKALSKKRATKAATYAREGKGKSKYAKKKALQAKGIFSPRSPFEAGTAPPTQRGPFTRPTGPARPRPANFASGTHRPYYPQPRAA